MNNKINVVNFNSNNFAIIDNDKHIARLNICTGENQYSMLNLYSSDLKKFIEAIDIESLEKYDELPF